MRIVATPLTSGPVTPGLAAISGGYQYRGREGWPFDPATRDDRGVIESPKGGAKIRQAERVKRSAEYARLRDQGCSHGEAIDQIGVERKTGARYKAAWLAVPCDHDFSESCTRCKERQQALAKTRQNVRASADVIREEAQAS